MTELAIAMTLLMSTSLMLKSIRLMERYDFAYPSTRLLIASVGAPWREDSTSFEEATRRQQQGLELIRAVPGVEAAILGVRTNCAVMHSTVESDRTAEGGPSIYIGENKVRGNGCTRVAPRFFSTIQMPLTDGRDFEDGDLTGEGAAVVDQRTAKHLFPHERAVGRRIKLGDFRSAAAWYTIVGVTKNHMLGFDPNPEMGADSSATIYLVTGAPAPLRYGGALKITRYSLSMSFFVRATGDVEATSLRVKRAIDPLTPAHGGAAVFPWDRDFQMQLKGERFLSLVFTLLGLASLMLGAAGLYSVVSYVTSQRMREFAVRIALGASRGNVIKLVMREAFTMAIGGTAVGAGFGMWAAFLLWERMWGIYPVDVEALVLAELTLILVTMGACIVPAIRAAKSDPLEIIRAP